VPQKWHYLGDCQCREEFLPCSDIFFQFQFQNCLLQLQWSRNENCVCPTTSYLVCRSFCRTFRRSFRHFGIVRTHWTRRFSIGWKTNRVSTLKKTRAGLEPWTAARKKTAIFQAHCTPSGRHVKTSCSSVGEKHTQRAKNLKMREGRPFRKKEPHTLSSKPN
jgi:hypothetical protein